MKREMHDFLRSACNPIPVLVSGEQEQRKPGIITHRVSYPEHVMYYIYSTWNITSRFKRDIIGVTQNIYTAPLEAEKNIC